MMTRKFRYLLKDIIKSLSSPYFVHFVGTPRFLIPWIKRWRHLCAIPSLNASFCSSCCLETLVVWQLACMDVSTVVPNLLVSRPIWQIWWSQVKLGGGMSLQLYTMEWWPHSCSVTWWLNNQVAPRKGSSSTWPKWAQLRQDVILSPPRLFKKGGVVSFSRCAAELHNSSMV
jgi:hypothetical protein